MRRFNDRVVLVTGASRGLGRALALAFAGEGATVLGGYRAREDEARETARLAAEKGGACSPIALDVRDAEAVERAVEGVVARHGRVDVLVNNAGVARDAPFAMMEAADWDEVIDTNLGGAFRCTRAVARGMMSRRAGAIVNVGSVAGVRASPGQANYAASKGGLVSFTRTVAAELAPYGVRVNAVLPGFLSVGMAARVDRRVLERHREHIALRRVGAPEEAARAVLFMASDEASYVVGQCLVVDGGLSL